MDNDIFVNGWNPENSYIFGWIMSDGCLRREGRNKTAYAVRICSNDEEIVKWLHNRLCVGNKIYKQGNNGFQIKYRNRESIEFMMNCGLTERKSLDMKFPDIPDAAFGDFLRGYFDGDGSIILRTNRYNTYGQASFTSGSIEFLQTLQEKLLEQNIESHLYRDGRATNNSFYLRATKRSEIEKLFNLMYPNDCYARLERKYNKFRWYLDCKPKYNIAKAV